MPQRGAAWALCSDETSRSVLFLWVSREQPALHCKASTSRRASSSWSCCCREPCPFFSLLALWLCLGEALKGVWQDVKGRVAGALPGAKEQLGEHHLKGPWVRMGLCLGCSCTISRTSCTTNFWCRQLVGCCCSSQGLRGEARSSSKLCFGALAGTPISRPPGNPG